MNIEQIIARIHNIPTVEIARATGLTYNTVKKAKAGGGTYSKTVTALTRYIEGLNTPAAE